MAFDPNNYLDIWNILTYEIVGSVNLMLVLGLIVIFYLSAKYAIPFQVGLIMMLLYFAIIVGITGNLGLWSIITLIVGAFTYWVIVRVLRRA